MKHLIFIISFLIHHSIFAFENKQAIVIEGEIESAVLRTANGCGIETIIIPSTGNPDLNAPPILGFIKFSNNYEILDTVPGTMIMGISYSPLSTVNPNLIDKETYYNVITDKGIYQYLLPPDMFNISEELYIDSIIIEGVIRMASLNGNEFDKPIVLLIESPEDSLIIKHHAQGSTEYNVSIYPELFSVTDGFIFITKKDSSGIYQFQAIELGSDTLYSQIQVNEMLANAKEIIKQNDSIYILSSPGDSLTVVTRLNLYDTIYTQKILYANSGIRATSAEFSGNNYFTYQPISDTFLNPLDKSIIVYNPVTDTFVDTININRKVHKFRQPKYYSGGFGNFPLITVAANWDSGINDTMYLNISPSGFYDYKIETGAYPDFMFVTHGCWFGVQENEIEKIKFEVFPNPASEDVNIMLSGLEKGKVYKLDLHDLSGKKHYSVELQAYQQLQLPLKGLSKGIYFLNLNTGNNNISQKLIIQ